MSGPSHLNPLSRPSLLSIREAAVYLGVPPETVRWWLRVRRFRKVKIGRGNSKPPSRAPSNVRALAVVVGLCGACRYGTPLRILATLLGVIPAALTLVLPNAYNASSFGTRKGRTTERRVLNSAG